MAALNLTEDIDPDINSDWIKFLPGAQKEYELLYGEKGPQVQIGKSLYNRTKEILK